MIEVRQAAPDDAPACGRIMQEWLDDTPWIPDLHTVEQSVGFCRRILIGKYDCFVAEKPASGFISVDNDSQIAALYVDADSRSNGIGTALLRHVMEKYNRLTLWVFEQNERAIKFYEHHGFVEIGRTDGDNDEGLPDLEMAWCK